ncbi:hypothetical protein SAMN04487916_11162 [Arthrobacter sp. ov407]|uniref:hypothetical protein n=1 Tax=Arthrobacter sp. ov407 TaxID=1761748 RepID=UPI00088020F2|nr:hypothetical protein [Arthrobacter sp. ov407]SDL60202.1 hypothetical protein SAMN04487916_11162 [Arthrobacter sp. ov407]
MKLLRAPRGLANPVVGLVVVHSIVFAGGLAALVLGIRSLDSAGLAVFSLVLGLIVCGLIGSVGVLVARQNQRRRYSLVEERNPGAAIARMMWNSALLSRFVSSKALLKGANRLGYGVDVVANAEGLSFWRGGRKFIELGAIPWSSLRSVEPCLVRASVGSRQVESVVFEFDSNPTLVSPIILYPGRGTAGDAIDRLMHGRPGVNSWNVR